MQVMGAESYIRNEDFLCGLFMTLGIFPLQWQALAMRSTPP